jgi:hypothetical protein
MPTYFSSPSMEAITSEDGCWLSFSGSRLIAARQSCGRRRGVYFATTFVPEGTHCVSSGQFFKRSHGHGGLSATQRQSPEEKQRVFQDLPSLRPHTPQRNGMAYAEEATGPESHRADGVHLWGHLSAPSILRPVQRTPTRINS